MITHPNANYYFGRYEADITPWVEYFLKGMSIGFKEVSARGRSEMSDRSVDSTYLEYLRSLDYRARRVISLFHTEEFIQSSEVASLLGLSMRQARTLLLDWVDQGWLEIVDPSKKAESIDWLRNTKFCLNHPSCHLNIKC